MFGYIKIFAYICIMRIFINRNITNKLIRGCQYPTDISVNDFSQNINRQPLFLYRVQDLPTHSKRDLNNKISSFLSNLKMLSRYFGNMYPHNQDLDTHWSKGVISNRKVNNFISIIAPLSRR